MSAISTALVLASEEVAEHSAPSPYLFGGIAFAVLLGLLVLTMMIKVGD